MLEIILLRLHQNRLADDGVGSAQRQAVDRPIILGCAVVIGLEVAHIADVPVLERIIRASVWRAVRIEMIASRACIRSLAVAYFIYVEALARVRTQAYFILDPDQVVPILL